MALPSAAPLATVREMDTLEWFASPTTCAASTRTCWRSQGARVWRGWVPTTSASRCWTRTGDDLVQGGSELGVLTLDDLAMSASGNTFVVSLMAAAPGSRQVVAAN